MNETLRRRGRWVVLWAGGGLLALIGLAYAAFVVLGALLFSGQHGVAGVPVSADQIVGTWSSPTRGSITFAADGGLTIRQVPLRGVTARADDPVVPVDRSGWTWRVNESQSTGGTALCFYTNNGGDYCTWDVTRPDGQLELDLVVGDPDMQQAYRYVKEAGDGTTSADYPAGKAPGFLKTGKKGEEQLKDFIGVDADFKQQRWSVGNAADYGRGSRYYDAFRRNQDQVICYEAKVGYVTGSFAAKQMTKDAALLALGRASNDPGKRSCNATEWHLFASAVTGRIEASSDMIARAKQLGIKIVVHLPR